MAKLARSSSRNRRRQAAIQPSGVGTGVPVYRRIAASRIVSANGATCSSAKGTSRVVLTPARYRAGWRGTRRRIPKGSMCSAHFPIVVGASSGVHAEGSVRRHWEVPSGLRAEDSVDARLTPRDLGNLTLPAPPPELHLRDPGPVPLREVTVDLRVAPHPGLRRSAGDRPLTRAGVPDGQDLRRDLAGDHRSGGDQRSRRRPRRRRAPSRGCPRAPPRRSSRRVRRRRGRSSRPDRSP